MTVKKTLLTLLLTGFGLWAQTPSFAPLPPSATPAGLGTNSHQALEQALARAIAEGTNATAPASSAVPAKVPEGTAQSSPPPIALPDAATGAITPTNRIEALQRERRQAADGGTNAVVPSAILVNPVKAPLGTNSSAPTLVIPNTTRPLRSATRPGNLAIPGFPGASNAVPPGLSAASGTPTNAVTRPPVITNPSLEEPLPQGMIDFRSADLNQVLEIYSTMVNRTVLRPATLPAPTITLTTHGELTVREGIQALEAVLGLNGITMVNMGEKFVKAMPEAQGNTAGARFDTNSAAQLPEMGQYITHVVQLKYAKPSELMPVLQPFIKIPNAVLPIDTSMMLVLRDYTENVKRMLELIKQIDVAVPSEFVSEVIPIKYAKAVDIAGALNSLSSGGGGATMGGGGTTGTRSSRTSGMNRSGMGGVGGMGGYPGQTTPGLGMQSTATGTTPVGAAGNSFSSRLQNIISRASQSGEFQVLGQTKIISDERTNSLLIYAGKDDMKTIKEIVAKLDVVLAQVLIEAAIISVTLTDSRDLGISYIQQTPSGKGYLQGLGAINNGNSLSQSPLVSAATNAASSLPSGFSYLASFGQDLDVTLTAAAASSRAKILQRPRIQTSHNEPASLFVGESRPYPTSSYYGGGGYGGYSSIQQLQIGVTIEVTPLINPDGLVVMDIHTKIDSFEGNVTIQNVGDVPITSSKEAQAKISVRDHDTIILGGLIETDKNNNHSGVPLLMDIPILGNLFRSSHADESRSELIVLIRPTVLPTPEIAALAAVAEKNKMPGVRGMEKEIRDEEQKRLKAADQMEKP
jgi:general secretion pathway protein D